KPGTTLVRGIMVIGIDVEGGNGDGTGPSKSTKGVHGDKGGPSKAKKGDGIGPSKNDGKGKKVGHKGGWKRIFKKRNKKKAKNKQNPSTGWKGQSQKSSK
ncbi:hypothetical protein Tco_0297995, partial [Tanacetum coccineum]